MTDKKIPLSELIWFLETRNWAYHNAKNFPHGGNIFDSDTYHTLFFISSISLIDRADVLFKGEKIKDAIKTTMGDNSWNYCRTLRNYILHEGGKISSEGLSDGIIVKVVAIEFLKSRNKKYHRKFYFLIDIMKHFIEIQNTILIKSINNYPIDKFLLNEITEESCISAINQSDIIPEYIKTEFDIFEFVEPHIDALRRSDFDRVTTLLQTEI